MKKINDLKKLFNKSDFLDHALTHKSWVNENPNKRTSNERLEFLGDAILEFVVSQEIFKKFPNQEEGYLTALRSNLVNTQNLAKVAEKMGIGISLYLSKGEEEGGGRENPSLLADTVEAIIGALYLDQGLNTVKKFIIQNIFADLAEKTKMPSKDAKSRLQEYVQSQGYPAPNYNVIKEFGPDHLKEFTVEVIINKKSIAIGFGKSKSEAEQEAAYKALASFNPPSR